MTCKNQCDTCAARRVKPYPAVPTEPGPPFEYVPTWRDRLAAVERELEALKASIGEPVAWRYKDSRGHYRYCGYKTGFDTEHSLLKPIPLYTLTKDKP